MKIQTYQSRVRMTDKIASQPLNVQANSAAFEGGGQSLVTIGGAIAAQSKWMDAEQKLVNASEVSKAEDAYEQELVTLENQIANTPAYNAKPQLAKFYFEQRAKVLKAGVASKITGRLAKTTFGAKARDMEGTSRLRLMKLARTRLVSESMAKIFEDVDTLEKEISKLNPDHPDYQKKWDALYGKGNKKGKFDEAVANGYIKAEDRYKYEKRSRGNVQVNQIGKLLQGATELSGTEGDIKNGTAAKKALEVYRDLESGFAPDLTPDDRQKLSEQALRLYHALDQRRVSLFNQKQAREKKDRVESQLNNFTAMSSRFLNADKSPDDQDAQAKRPTLIEIATALETKDITESQKNTLLTFLERKGAIVTDRPYVASLVEKIRKSDSKAEIEKVYTEALTNLKRLNYTDIEFLRNIAQQYNANTPRMKRAKIFGKLLEGYIKPSGILDKILPGASQRASLVEARFDLAILVGAEPRDAFNEAIESFNTDHQVNLREIPLPRFLPSYPGEGIGDMDIVNRDLSTWTLSDVQQSREKTKKNYKGRVDLLASELFSLEMIEKYIAQRTAAKNEADRVSNDETNELKERNR